MRLVKLLPDVTCDENTKKSFTKLFKPHTVYFVIKMLNTRIQIMQILESCKYKKIKLQRGDLKFAFEQILATPLPWISISTFIASQII